MQLGLHAAAPARLRHQLDGGASCRVPAVSTPGAGGRAGGGAGWRRKRGTVTAVLEAAEPASAVLDAAAASALLPSTGAAVSALVSKLATIYQRVGIKTEIALCAGFYLFLPPGPLAGILDYYVLRPLDETKRKQFRPEDFEDAGEELGRGNWGAVFLGQLRMPKDVPLAERKKGRVVLKRAKNDGLGARPDFLQRGTLARGARELGQAEAYMNSLISRWAPQVGAAFIGTCTVPRGQVAPTSWLLGRGLFGAGDQFLVWRFESDATLADFLKGNIPGTFPDNLETVLYGSVKNRLSVEQRLVRIARGVLRQLLQRIAAMHAIGVVHRDLKPQNVLITASGKALVIDFGAAVDLRTGINFNPESGLLDPEYSPPESFVLPNDFPRAPSPALCAVASPAVFSLWGPDLFDTYSVGVMLLQMSLAPLRTGESLRRLQLELQDVKHDLDQWRRMSQLAARCDFSALDESGGWALARRLICKRDGWLLGLGGRLSARQALRDPFFRRK